MLSVTPRVLALPLLIAAVLAGCATTEELHPEAPELSALKFEGNSELGAEDLERGLATRPSSWVPFTRPSRFDTATFQGDLDRIRTLYRANGYFEARVLRIKVEPVSKNKVRVTVVIDEGQPSLVRDLGIEGQDDLPPDLKRDLKRPFPLVPGAIFTEAAYTATKAAILARVHEYAFAEAEVAGEAIVDSPAHAVDVHFTAHAGAHYRYSKFIIRGNVKVPLVRIQQEIDEVMKTGDDFQTSDLDAAQKNLFDLGVFSNVVVEAGTPDPQSGTIPVVATVVEAPFHTLRPGVGVGIDVEHQEVHLSGGYSDRNFLGGLRRLDFDNTLALEWLPSVFNAAEAAVPAFISTLKLTQPEIFHHGIDLVPSLQVQRAAELGFGYWALRGRVAVPIKFSPSVVFTPAYNAEVLFFDSGSAFSGLDLSPSALLNLTCQVCVLSYLQQTLTWDRRNNDVEPTKGFYAQLDLQEAGSVLGGNFTNVRVQPEIRGYFSLTKRDVLALRFQVGALFEQNGQSSPIDQRFFLGGINSVRGYGAERLSPMVRVNTCHPIPNPKVPGATIPSPLCAGYNNGLGILDIQVGGNGMIEGSLELRHKLSDLFNVVAFVDSGEVTSQPFAFDFSPNGLAITPGLGLRIITPIGALRADLAFRVTDPERPYTLAQSTFPQPKAGGSNYPSPPATGASGDTCAWPFVPLTGWADYTQPSSCKSDFLRRLAFNIAIGEAF